MIAGSQGGEFHVNGPLLPAMYIPPAMNGMYVPTTMNVHSPPSSPLHPPLLLVVRMQEFYVFPPPLPTLGVDVTIDAFINEDEEPSRVETLTLQAPSSPKRDAPTLRMHGCPLVMTTSQKDFSLPTLSHLPFLQR